MNRPTHFLPALAALFSCVTLTAQQLPPPFPNDPASALERTCFQTSRPWSPLGNLRSDVTLVYGIDKTLTNRINTWRDRGYRVHLMTGVAWGEYQDYLYGRFDGENHVDNAQTDRNGKVISHGGDVYYMCPAENYGDFLSVGVQKGLEAGVEAVHLEEPEFWARAGYSEGFKREWQSFYHEDWQPPQSSPEAQWRASKLKYFLYRRALQQVFNHVQDFNKKNDKSVRCYVPTHSLINYAHWRIVSPQSSLAKLDGCDGYIAQVWTGTSRTPNHYRGLKKERTFETAFLEYGAMQNLVRATGRSVWYLNDPIEDNPFMESIQAPPLAEQLCFDLYAASRAVTAAYRPALTELGITYPQYLVLIVLWEHESLTVRELGEHLRLDHGTLTPLLKRMDAAGLVERRRDNVDERYVVVSLASRGESLRQHAERVQCDMKDQLGLDPQEFEDLQTTLRVLTARVSS